MATKCIPGMPCYNNDVIVYTTYPAGCQTTTPGPFTLPLSSDDLYYAGPNLPNSEILNTDTLTVALQKIDQYLTGGGGGGAYTFLNGLTELVGEVKLGGPLMEPTTIDLAGFSLLFTDIAILTNSTVALYPTAFETYYANTSTGNNASVQWGASGNFNVDINFNGTYSQLGLTAGINLLTQQAGIFTSTLNILGANGDLQFIQTVTGAHSNSISTGSEGIALNSINNLGSSAAFVVSLVDIVAITSTVEAGGLTYFYTVSEEGIQENATDGFAVTATRTFNTNISFTSITDGINASSITQYADKFVLSSSAFYLTINGASGTAGQFLGSDGFGAVTWINASYWQTEDTTTLVGAVSITGGELYFNNDLFNISSATDVYLASTNFFTIEAGADLTIKSPADVDISTWGAQVRMLLRDDTGVSTFLGLEFYHALTEDYAYFTDNRILGKQTGLEYNNVSLGADFTDASLIHYGFAKDNFMANSGIVILPAAIDIQSIYDVYIVNTATIHIESSGGPLLYILGDGAAEVKIHSNGGPVNLIGDTINITHDSGFNFPASSVGRASLNVPHGIAPTTPIDGDVWTTTTSMYARISGVTVDLAAGGGGWATSGTTTLTGATTIDLAGVGLSFIGDLDFSVTLNAPINLITTSGESIYVTSNGPMFMESTNGAINVTHGGGFNLPASSTAIASLNVPHGTAPTTPVDGDIWTTTAGLFVRINGVTIGPLT